MDSVSNKIVISDKCLKYKSDQSDGVLDPKIGLSISPNYAPRFLPPLHRGMSDFFKMTGLTSSDDHVPLPNSWQTISVYRY